MTPLGLYGLINLVAFAVGWLLAVITRDYAQRLPLRLGVVLTVICAPCMLAGWACLALQYRDPFIAFPGLVAAFLVMLATGLSIAWLMITVTFCILALRQRRSPEARITFRPPATGQVGHLAYMSHPPRPLSHVVLDLLCCIAIFATLSTPAVFLGTLTIIWGERTVDYLAAALASAIIPLGSIVIGVVAHRMVAPRLLAWLAIAFGIAGVLYFPISCVPLLLR